MDKIIYTQGEIPNTMFDGVNIDRQLDELLA